jgi:hypothetical protein
VLIASAAQVCSDLQDGFRRAMAGKQIAARISEKPHARVVLDHRLVAMRMLPA